MLFEGSKISFRKLGNSLRAESGDAVNASPPCRRGLFWDTKQAELLMIQNSARVSPGQRSRILELRAAHLQNIEGIVRKRKDVVWELQQATVMPESALWQTDCILKGGHLVYNSKLLLPACHSRIASSRYVRLEAAQFFSCHLPQMIVCSCRPGSLTVKSRDFHFTGVVYTTKGSANMSTPINNNAPRSFKIFLR